MADYVRTQEQGVPAEMRTRYKDMDDTTHALVMSVRDQWASQLLSDEAADDSDKNFNVPAGREWQLLWIWVELTTTATVGDRNICVTLYDDTNDIIGEVRVGATQAASLTRYYMMAPALADLGAFRDTNYLMTPLPPTLMLRPNYHVRVWDCNAVDAAADDMVVHLAVAWRAA